MTRHDVEQARAERLAWDHALGRRLAADDRAFLRGYASRRPGGEEPSARVALAVRRITHGDPAVATGVERRVLFEEIMERREGRPTPVRSSSGAFRWVGAAAAAALVVLLLIPWGAPIPTEMASSEHVAVRGDRNALPAAGFGISGVDSEGSEYEVIHGEGLCAADALRFYLTVRDDRTPYYALFGVQDLDDPTWYVPAPPDAAAPIIPEIPIRTWMIPFEIEVRGAHVAGPVSIVCILSEEPIPFARLEAAWRNTDGEDISSRAADAAADVTGGTVRILVEEIEILDDCGRRQ
ncbi:MAG: hypothetical protein ABIK09_17760 [Pseudomonadota bacterium]